jgi:hypothetical protein
MTEAIVMDGGKRGQIVKVCADPSCHVHHPDTPSPQQIERQRAEERKRIEKDKLAITTRHRILAAVLERVSEPLKKGDLLTVASYLIGQNESAPMRRPDFAGFCWKSVCWIQPTNALAHPMMHS